jgi:integrase
VEPGAPPSDIGRPVTPPRHNHPAAGHNTASHATSADSRKIRARIPRHVSLHSLRHAAITNALDAGVPLRDAQSLARHADPRTTELYDRARGNLDRHGVHYLTAYVAGV